MNKTKIEWCDSTWNPVTGCLHNCDYCYARKISDRFKSSTETLSNRMIESHTDDFICYEGKYNCSFPFGFKPTFYKERLSEPANIKKPQTIFVCSMADLFGSWVPDHWIKEVFEACQAAPQHKYLFLTKNPSRYAQLASQGKLPYNNNFWYGSTITGNNEKRFVSPKCDSQRHNTFLSIEPLLNIWDFNPYGEFDCHGWIIIGAQSGPGAVKPKKEWTRSIAIQAIAEGVPVFMKDSLKPYWDELMREFPEGLEVGK
jgi:protein gp37